MKKVISIVLALVLAIGALTGCSSKSSGGSGTSASGSASSGGTSSGTIKIGILGPYSGDNAQYGVAVRNGAQLYIDKVNNAGGINGKKIEAIVYDEKGDSTEAVTAFDRMASEGITGLIGDVLSSNTIAVVGEANPINMPMITASATAEGVTYNKDSNTVYSNVFRTCFIDPFQGEKMAEYASQVLSAKTAAVVYQTGNDYSVGLKDAFLEKAKTLGLNVVDVEGYAAGDKDFHSQLTNINAKSPDVIFCPDYYQDDGLIVTQARTIGIKSTFMGGDGWANVSKFASAADLEGSVYCSAYASGSTDKIKQFETDYTAKYGADSLNMFAALGYDAAVVMLDAVTSAEKQNLKEGSDEFKAAVIDAMKHTTSEGITSKYAFDDHNNPIKQAVIIKLTDGKEAYSQMF